MNYKQLLGGISAIYFGAKSVKEAVGEREKREKGYQLAEGGADMNMRLRTVHSIDERVAYIVGMVKKGRHHPTVHEFTRKTLSKKCGDGWCVPEKDYWGEVCAIFEAVRKNVRYTGDTYGTDLFMHPKNTLRFGTGDCDCASALLGACLQCVGYPVKLRVVQLKGDKDFGHIYLLVGLPPRNPRQWRALDRGVVPAQPPGWEVPKHMVTKYRDFPVPA